MQFWVELDKTSSTRSLPSPSPDALRPSALRPSPPPRIPRQLNCAYNDGFSSWDALVALTLAPVVAFCAMLVFVGVREIKRRYQGLKPRRLRRILERPLGYAMQVRLKQAGASVGRSAGRQVPTCVLRLETKVHFFISVHFCPLLPTSFRFCNRLLLDPSRSSFLFLFISLGFA